MKASISLFYSAAPPSLEQVAYIRIPAPPLNPHPLSHFFIALRFATCPESQPNLMRATPDDTARVNQPPCGTCEPADDNNGLGE